MLPTRDITIKMAKFQDKERILKASREKQEVTYKRAQIKPEKDTRRKKTSGQYR